MKVDWPIRIVAVASAFPPRVVSNATLLETLGADAASTLDRSGVAERHWVDATAPDPIGLGARAASRALDQAGVAPNDVDLIVNASGTQAQAIPDGAPLLQARLGLGNSGTATMSVHTTCLSFLTALKTAGSLIHAGVYRTALIVSAEAGSVALNPEDPESYGLIGDGAAAAVLTRSRHDEPSRIEALRFETYGAGAELVTVRGGGTLRHPNAAATRPEDHLFAMNKPALLKTSLKRLPGFIERIFSGESIHDIPHVVPHQASAATFQVLERLGLAPTQIHRTLAEQGNCIAASIPLALGHAIDNGRIRRGDRVLLIGSAAGFSLGALVLTY
ncbi:MAG: 3-oxoacyl-[acyl-carrier-protein] synthase III C-terminal domain-containing protein [Myxococcota bacterium]